MVAKDSPEPGALYIPALRAQPERRPPPANNAERCLLLLSRVVTAARPLGWHLIGLDLDPCFRARFRWSDGSASGVCVVEQRDEGFVAVFAGGHTVTWVSDAADAFVRVVTPVLEGA